MQYVVYCVLLLSLPERPSDFPISNTVTFRSADIRFASNDPCALLAVRLV
jgi:hypothetical protein